MEYDSGPFCQHWCVAYECEHLCRCGHTCAKHYMMQSCDDENCECESFENEDEK